jgi:Flp pilus assembly protein TadB
LEVGVREVVALGQVAAAAVFLLALSAFLAVLLLAGDPTLLPYAVGALVAAPLLAFLAVVGYPEALARRLQVRSLGRTPEAVNYLTMSLRLSPALNRAVEFAAENSEEPLAGRLRALLWDVHMRRHAGIEDAFLAFANDWGAWNEDFKRALYALNAATLERTEEGLDRSLAKARQIVYQGTRQRTEAYAASLRAPTTALFALGILLPMILGAMLPLLAIGGVDLAALDPARAPTPDATLAVALLLDVVFPAATFLFAYHILGRRPGTAGPPPAETLPWRARRVALAAALALALLAVPLALIVPPPYGPLAPLAVLVAATGVYLGRTAAPAKAARDRVRRMEGEFPDALYQLGSALGEGLSVEVAMRRVAANMAGSAIADLFARIGYTLQVTRRSLEDALFGQDGLLRTFPSRLIRASMKMVVEVAGKDPATAGKAVMDMSAYLRDLQRVDADMRRELGSVVEAMKTTAALFAPVVLGITCALYLLLADAFAAFATLAMDPAAFFGVVGVYLVLTVVAVTYFANGIEEGGDAVAYRWTLARVLPLAFAVFLASLFVGRLFLGV